MTIDKLKAIKDTLVSGAESLKEKLTPTRWELESESDEPYPLKTARRAVCYAAKIYNLATDGGHMDRRRIDNYLRSVNSGSEGVVETATLLVARRSYSYTPSLGAGALRGERGFTFADSRPGLVIMRVDGKARKGKWRQIYVVFRGSRGGLPGKENLLAAGWTAESEGGKRENVDWTANFDDEQVPWPFAGPVADARVHRGFVSIYSSLRARILSKLRGMEASEIIVTGHSLGGALTTLCAYDLRHELPDETVVCLSFNAPRAGNEAFARDFNRVLAQQTYTSSSDDGGFRQAFRFDQKDDPVTFGMRHASKYNYVSDYKALPESRREALSEKTRVIGKLSGDHLHDAMLEKQIAVAATGKVGAVALTKSSDYDKPFYHVKHKKTVSFFGEHHFTKMLDSIVGGGASAALGIHD